MGESEKREGKAVGKERSSRTAALVGLFTAVVLAATPGCGDTMSGRAGHTHVDSNGDGYCDEDGEPMSSSRSQSSHYRSTSGWGTSSSSHTSGGSATVSSGSHGGIGGGSHGGGG